MSVRRPPGWLEPLVRSGEYHRLAARCWDDAGLAELLGTTTDSLGKARRVLRRHGLTVPTVQEIRRGGAPVLANIPADTPVSGNVVFHGAGEIVEVNDFDDEEPTQPGVTSPWGVIEGLPPSDLAPPNLGVHRISIEDTQPGWSYPEALNDNWRAREEPTASRRLTREECPDGTLILWASDVHIPIHHEVACKLMIDCAERTDVSHVIAGGDILDMNCLSRHAKESRRTVEHATVLEEVEPGRWLLNWLAQKKTKLILGNHEDRLKRFIDENPAFHGSVVSNFARVVDLPAGIEVIPQGGEVRLGNMVWTHGDAEFKNGTGGAHPATKLLNMAPDQSSMCGHLHRMATACRTSRDENNIPRTRRAWTMGHMSHEHMHYGYVSNKPNWQMGFGLIRVYWEEDRPRWSVYPIEVLFDRHNRPYFEFGGWVYR